MLNPANNLAKTTKTALLSKNHHKNHRFAEFKIHFKTHKKIFCNFHKIL